MDVMGIIQRYIAAAQNSNCNVVLPEGEDPRVLVAARCLLDEGIAHPIVLGSRDEMQQAAKQAEVLADGLEIIAPESDPRFEAYVEAYAEQRQLKPRVAQRMVKRPLFFGGMMVARGDADTLVAGVNTATATVIQAGALTVGYAPGIATASSFFLMVLPEFQGRADYPLIFADCAVNILPSPEELADIAQASYNSAAKLLADPPRVALLSFSTQGSAAHCRVDRVTQALAIIHEKAPDAPIDGEFQADAALIERVAKRKVKHESQVAGQANVLIFPDLDAGNIAYKLTQYLGGAQAIGPFLQGFAKPISDLSRGASAEDIVATTAVCLSQLE